MATLLYLAAPARPKHRRLFLAAALALAGLAAPAQTLTITNGVQTYSAVSNTVVTLTGTSELIVTGTNNPLFGATIYLNSANAWIVLPYLRPSVVRSNNLSQFRINGAAAVAGSNCRVDEFVMGSIIIPHAPSIAPLQIFSGPHFSGASAQLGLYTYYTNTALGGLNRNVGSFKLMHGYQATFAQNADGTGASQVFIAQDGDLNVGLLAGSLNEPVSFVRVFPWRWIAKRGWADTAGVGGDGVVIKPYWFYDWGDGSSSATDAEYAPMKWSGSSGTSSINNKQGSTEVLGYNEPDNTAQANMTIAAAIADWPHLMQWGLRAGAPAVSDSGVSGQGLDWIYGFMSQATNLGYRVDFVPIHWYKCGQSASQLTNYLAGVYQTTGRPVWLTEFNYGANWCDVNGSQPPTPAQEASAVSQFIAALENAPWVERYSIYNWVTTNRELVEDDGVTLTAAGLLYRDTPSTLSYRQAGPPAGPRGIAQFHFETDALDSSGYGNDAIAVGLPVFAPGETGQGMWLDGTNSYLQLPATMAGSNAFSFAGWVYWNGGASWQRLFDFGNDTSHYLFLTPNSSAGTLRFAINNGSGEQVVETAGLPTGQWVHVAVTLGAGIARLYTNGVLAAALSGFTYTPASFHPTRNFLGKSQFPADPLFNGALDEVQIADYALTASQIASLQTDAPPQFATNFVYAGIAAPFTAFSTNLAGAAGDPDSGNTVTYSKATGPAWLTVNAGGLLSGTPGAADGGTNYFTVRATDSAGAGAFAVVSVVVPITYASGTWTNDADGNWGDAFNWSGGVIANGGNGGNYTADFSTLNLTADRTVTLDQAHSIGGLKFGDSSGAQNWLVVSSNGSVLTLDTGSTVTPTAVVNQNTATLALPLAGANGLVKSGAGTLVFSNANSFSGTLYVDSGQSSSGNDGVLRVAAPGAFGGVTAIAIRNQNSATSSLQLNGASGSVASAAAITLNGRNNSVVAIENLAGSNTLSGGISINTGGSSYLIQSDAGQLALGGTLTSAATGNRTFTFQGTGNIWVSGSIQNGLATNAVAKTGSGTLIFAGVNTYTNTTTVSGGTLLVNGTNGLTPLTVSGSATLGGRGVLRGAVTVLSGGTLAPGTNAAAVGTLTVSNSVTLQGGATARLKISKTPQANDLLRVAGTGATLTLGGTLWVTNLGGTLAAGDTFRLFNAVSYSGSFAALNLPALGVGLAWQTNALGTGLLSVAATLPPQFAGVVQTSDENFLFSGSGSAGVTYELDAATNLAPPVAWLAVTNTVADQNGLFQMWDSQATNFPSRFYRITGSQ